MINNNINNIDNNNNNININNNNNISNLSAGLRNIHISSSDHHIDNQGNFISNPDLQQQQQQQHLQYQNHNQFNEVTSELREFFNNPFPNDGFSLITHRSAPNGFKIAIILSELNYNYNTIHLDFNKNDHRLPQFLQLNPNGRVPALIDHNISNLINTNGSNNINSNINSNNNGNNNRNNNGNNNNNNNINGNNGNNSNNNNISVHNKLNNNLNQIKDKNQISNNSVSLWESGSIIVYLVNKKCKEDNNICPQIWSNNLIEQSQILSWLFFQTSGHAPMIGQALHFRYFHSINLPSAIDRYTDEVRRVYGVLEMALSERREALIMELDSENAESYSSGLTPLSQSRYFDSPVWLVGDRCTIADLCFVPWNYVVDRIGIDLKAEFPEVYKWTKRMMRRPAVIRALTEANN